MKKPLVTPHGFKEIIEVFGDIRKYIGPDGHLASSWQANYLGRVSLPFPLRLAWDPSRTITQMSCRRRMTSAFAGVFGTIQDRELQASVTSFGGCFAFRPQRTGHKLSAHSWGIAIDLNSESNPQGSTRKMPAGLIDIFRSAGFEWEATGRAPTATRCTFSFALDIDVGRASLFAASNYLLIDGFETVSASGFSENQFLVLSSRFSDIVLGHETNSRGD